MCAWPCQPGSLWACRSFTIACSGWGTVTARLSPLLPRPNWPNQERGNCRALFPQCTQTPALMDRGPKEDNGAFQRGPQLVDGQSFEPSCLNYALWHADIGDDHLESSSGDSEPKWVERVPAIFFSFANVIFYKPKSSEMYLGGFWVMARAVWCLPQEARDM